MALAFSFPTYAVGDWPTPDVKIFAVIWEGGEALLTLQEAYIAGVLPWTTLHLVGEFGCNKPYWETFCIVK